MVALWAVVVVAAVVVEVAAHTLALILPWEDGSYPVEEEEEEEEEGVQ